MSDLLRALSTTPSSVPMFFTGKEVITAGRIRAAATAMAGRLSRGGTIHLHTHSAALFVAGLLAAARKDCKVCCPAHAQLLYLNELGAELLITDEQSEFPNVVRAELAPGEEDVGASCEAPPLVFYTSGSSGKPKRVEKAIAQLDMEVVALETVWPRGAQRVFATVSHQHIYGMLFRIFWPIHTGGISSDFPAKYWEQLSDHLVSGATLVSSPAHLTRLVPLGSANPDRVFSSGAPLPFGAVQDAMRTFGKPPIEVLGSTETGGIGWRQRMHEDALWTPLPGVELIIEDKGQALGVRSPYVLGRETVLTGDRAERVGDLFRLIGRDDRVIKVDGKRVSLSRVEEALLAHPFIAAAAATDLPARRDSLGAIVELTAAGKAALGEFGAFRLSRRLRRDLAAHLEPAERPKHWRFIVIPLNLQGKRIQTSIRAVFDRNTVVDDGEALRAPGQVAEATPNSAKIVLILDPNLLWFEGHFPEQPVLPGIAQVHMAMLWTQKLWSWTPKGSSLSQLKYRCVLRPGDVVELHLTRLAQQERLKFTYQRGGVVASEGVIGDFE